MGFEFLIHKNGRKLKKNKWTKKSNQIKIDEGNLKGIESIISILSNHILSKVGEYKNMKDLCENIIKFHETPIQDEEYKRLWKIHKKILKLHKMWKIIETPTIVEVIMDKNFYNGWVEGRIIHLFKMRGRSRFNWGGDFGNPSLKHLNLNQAQRTYNLFGCNQIGHYKNRRPLLKKEVKEKVIPKLGDLNMSTNLVVEMRREERRRKITLFASHAERGVTITQHV